MSYESIPFDSQALRKV